MQVRICFEIKLKNIINIQNTTHDQQIRQYFIKH